MKKLLVVLAVVAVSVSAVSCGPKAKGKQWGKKMANMENKIYKQVDKMNDSDKEKFGKGFVEGYKNTRTPNKY